MCGRIASHTNGPIVRFGNVVVVHHIEVDPVGAGSDHGADFLAQSCKIGR